MTSRGQYILQMSLDKLRLKQNINEGNTQPKPVDLNTQATDNKNKSNCGIVNKENIGHTRLRIQGQTIGEIKHIDQYDECMSEESEDLDDSVCDKDWVPSKDDLNGESTDSETSEKSSKEEEEPNTRCQ